MDDEKLDQHCFFGLADGVENGVEGGLAIDQQAHFVVRQARHASQLRHGPQGRVGIGGASGQRFFYPRPPVEFGDSLAHFLVGLAPGLDVTIEGTAAEDQIGDEREVGNEHQ